MRIAEKKKSQIAALYEHVPAFRQMSEVVWRMATLP